MKVSKSKAEKYAQKYREYNKLLLEKKPEVVRCWIGGGKGARCIAEVDDNGNLAMTADNVSMATVPEFIKWLIDTYGMPSKEQV